MYGTTGGGVIIGGAGYLASTGAAGVGLSITIGCTAVVIGGLLVTRDLHMRRRARQPAYPRSRHSGLSPAPAWDESGPFAFATAAAARAHRQQRISQYEKQKVGTE